MAISSSCAPPIFAAPFELWSILHLGFLIDLYCFINLRSKGCWYRHRDTVDKVAPIRLGKSVPGNTSHMYYINAGWTSQFAYLGEGGVGILVGVAAGSDGDGQAGLRYHFSWRNGCCTAICNLGTKKDILAISGVSLNIWSFNDFMMMWMWKDKIKILWNCFDVWFFIMISWAQNLGLISFSAIGVLQCTNGVKSPRAMEYVKH